MRLRAAQRLEVFDNLPKLSRERRALFHRFTAPPGQKAMMVGQPERVSKQLERDRLGAMQSPRIANSKALSAL